MIRIPEYVASIKPYVPGKPVEELERELGISGSVKLASNENPVGPSKKALKALDGKILEVINRYPDGGGHYLKQSLAKKLDIKPEEIILGNGSNEVIDIAVKTFMKPGDEAVMAWPTFVVYPMSVQAQGCRGIKVPLRDFRHDLETMADAVTEKTRMFFIANPNNPTGTINTDEEMMRLIEHLPEDIILVVDEAYYEYIDSQSYADSMKHFRAGKNILVLRTFSKIYGLAGLRIGYGIAKDAIIEEMNKIREPFNTNSLAQAAALAALEDEEHVRLSKEMNEKGKIYLYAQFESLGMKYVPTEANFIYILTEQDSGKINESLLKKGVIVRPMGPGALRVTIGLEKENKRFVEALKETISN
jgi:histidinol-phosphate aminotransferase